MHSSRKQAVILRVAQLAIERWVAGIHSSARLRMQDAATTTPPSSFFAVANQHLFDPSAEH